jgi:pimeloyl-ACP methyl ester carboxylesterase
VPVRGLNAFVRGALAGCSTRPGRITAAVRAGYLAPYDSWQHRIAIHRFVQDIPLGPSDPAWNAVSEVTNNLHRWKDVPVMICWGERDFVFDGAFLREWRQRLPGAEFHTWHDCGHYIVEDAHEELVPLMRDFFDRNPLGQRS